MEDIKLTGGKAALLNIVVIVLMTAIAIIAHDILPAPVDDLNFVFDIPCRLPAAAIQYGSINAVV